MIFQNKSRRRFYRNRCRLEWDVNSNVSTAFQPLQRCNGMYVWAGGLQGERFNASSLLSDQTICVFRSEHMLNAHDKVPGKNLRKRVAGQSRQRTNICYQRWQGFSTGANTDSRACGIARKWKKKSFAFCIEQSGERSWRRERGRWCFMLRSNILMEPSAGDVGDAGDAGDAAATIPSPPHPTHTARTGGYHRTVASCVAYGNTPMRSNANSATEARIKTSFYLTTIISNN